jgi:aminopeptidase N
MKRARLLAASAFLVVGLPATMAQSACVTYEMQITLDPNRHTLKAEVSVRAAEPLPIQLKLARELEVKAVTLEDMALPHTRTNDSLETDATLSPGQVLKLQYEGTFPAVGETVSGSGTRNPVIGPTGTFLPEGSGWYPELLAETCGYSLSLSVKGGHKGLTPGRLVAEDENGDLYRAKFVVDHPIEGISVFAGPYAIRERRVGSITLRTYFHREIESLAGRYLNQTEIYLRRFNRQIGPYPYASFSIVSSPHGVGLGFPYLTYMGKEVLKLPFIPTTSLPHEVLHSWWGNGVLIDYAAGNWAEGLTTYLADYAIAEEQSVDAARQMRFRWLVDYAALPRDRDEAVIDFVARDHGASRIIGYNKTAMIFHMLRRQLGDEAFMAGLQQFWREYRFDTASWSDLIRAFTSSSGRDLDGFFSQWIERKGAPALSLEATANSGDDGDSVDLTLRQTSPIYLLEVPVRITLRSGQIIDRVVPLDDIEIEERIPLPSPAASITVDPEFDVFRLLPPADAPPVLRGLMLASDVDLFVEPGSRELQHDALSLVSAVNEGEIHEHESWPATLGQRPLVVIGRKDWLRGQLSGRAALQPPGAGLPEGSVQVWARRDKGGRLTVLVGLNDIASVKMLERRLPHYGSKSFVVFVGRDTKATGVWQEPMTTTIRQFN